MVLDDISFYTRKTSQNEQKKSSLFATWTTDAIRLFRLLSWQGWRERTIPHLNKFVKKLVADRKITQASKLVSKTAHQWEGNILDSGLTGFLSGGFLAMSIDKESGAFLVFICCPLEYHTQWSKTWQPGVPHPVVQNMATGTHKRSIW